MDDIYIDDTHQRVMLCTSSTYPTDDTETCEIQIPHTTWNDTTIQVTVNLGDITSDTFYLFVFDSNNDANAEGFEVTEAGRLIRGVDIQ